MAYPLKKMVHTVHLLMNNIALVGFLGSLLVIVPIIGIMAVHESEYRK